MTKKGNISVFQLFCIFFVCRVIALFTFIIPDKTNFPMGDRSVIFIPFVIVGFLAAIPVMLIVGKNNDGTVFQITDRLSPAVTKITALILTAGAMWSAAVSTTRFELFMGTTMFERSELFVLIVLLFGAAILIAQAGLETTARISVIIIAMLAGSLIFVVGTTLKDFEYTNLEPVLQNGIPALFVNGYSAVARTSELASLLVFAPKIKGDIKKGFFFWLLVFGGMISVIFTAIAGVTGAYGERQMFQLYTLTVLAKIGVLERLDDLICALWVLCSLARTAFYLLTSEILLEHVFPIKNKSRAYIGISLIIISGYLVFSRSVSFFSGILGSGMNEIIFGVMLILLPLAIYLADKIKTKKHERRTGA